VTDFAGTADVNGEMSGPTPSPETALQLDFLDCEKKFARSSFANNSIL